MWLRRAASLPWQVLGAVTLLSASLVTIPIKNFTRFLWPKQGPGSPVAKKYKAMPKEFYDVSEVSDMLKMVRAAMLDKTEQLHSEHSKVSQLGQQVDELQQSLENVNHLFAQEQQHRLGLQAELEEAETAAADLRQMLTIFFGESHHGSPNSSPNTPRHNTGLHHDSTWGHAPSQLSSGLPGTLNRADSRLQLELAGIQNRLKKIAQLRDNIPCSSPRSADRISPWLSLSANGNTSPTGELGRMRTLGRISPVKTSPLKADSLQTSSDDTRIRSINTRHQGLPSGLATSTGADAASNSEAEDHANADAESIDGSQSGCNTDE